MRYNELQLALFEILTKKYGMTPLERVKHISFKASLGLNVLLLIALAALFLFWISRELHVLYYENERPHGSVITLQAETPIYHSGSEELAFSLPKGTMIQESTPHGMATFYGRESLLVIRTPNHSFSTNSLTDIEPNWSGVKYSFEKNDKQ